MIIRFLLILKYHCYFRASIDYYFLETNGKKKFKSKNKLNFIIKENNRKVSS